MSLTGLVAGFVALTLIVVVGLVVFLRRRFAAGQAASTTAGEEK